jgi:Mg2+-importing ATPase
MVERKVIVKRLQSIENFGSMDVLCCDKTGTVTEGQIVLEGSVDSDGGDSQKVLLFGHLNSLFQNGFSNPMDDAIRAHPFSDHSFYSKLDEVPYDFTRRRITVLVRDQRNQKNIVITKGAFENVLDCCDRVELPDGWTEPRSAAENRVRGIWKILGNRGFRSLGVAYKETTADHISKCDETGMTFLGILTFYDPPRQGIVKTLARLRKMGTALKIISGDNRLIASYVAQQIGLKTDHILTGSEICNISDQALAAITSQAEVFAEIQPNQKEKIIFALKKTGHVVGYMGDGINDATALHAADVGISVNNAVDVAKEAADILLMDKDLSVLADGIREGRKTFANTLKYVFMASSANFGNMFSMAGASLLLPFLPLLPKQILLTNLLTDFPEMTVASDNVDREMITQPKRWDVSAIRRFMLYFGLTSSFFDFLTFTILLLLFHADASQFRAGWFIESVTSAALVVLVIRSRRVFWKSSPSVLLLTATTLVCAAAIAMPYVPIIANMFGFKPIPLYFIPIVVAIIAAYATVTELVKGFYYKKAVTQQQPVMSSAMVPQDAH